MTALVEIGIVMRAAPGPRSSTDEVARWYELKARLLEHLADDEAGPAADRFLVQADAAHRHAAALLAG